MEAQITLKIIILMLREIYQKIKYIIITLIEIYQKIKLTIVLMPIEIYLKIK